jgi:beta-lactamase regulating signal transducer with metallopeptidase domain
MAWHTAAWYWLAHAALGGFLLLGAGGLAVRLCRQPVRRLRLIELTLGGCLLVPWLNQLPGWPQCPVGRLPRADLEPPATPPPGPAPAAAAAGLPEPAPPPPLAGSPVATTPSPAPPPDPRVPAATVPAEPSPAFALPWSLPRLLVLAYAGTVAGLFLRWSLGVARLVHWHRTAAPAPRPVVELFRAIAGPAGAGVRLLVSDRVSLPLTFHGWRPVILLPGSLCRAGDPAALRYCLAHEWSHVERRDLWRWYLATLAQFLCFYQPLFWWLRRQLRLCQDYLADARAAEQAPGPEDYADYLVRLARRRLEGPVPAALGIGDRRSHIYRRVIMLIHHRQPLERHCRRLWNLGATVGAAALLVAVSALRLDAGDAPAAPQAPPQKETPQEAPKEAQQGETLTYTGKVTEKGTGKPIPGATVTVRRSLYGDPTVQGEKVLQETKHQTDAEGKYRFTLPPEQVAERYLYIELDVEHPDYAPRGRFGYALSMIRKNEKLGGRPFFEHVELRPGQPITGRVETPDGQPAAGVKLLAYSVTDEAGTFEYGSFARARTDDQGQFRVVLTTPGHAVFWLLPEKYAPSRHLVKDNKRGDLGVFGLQKGISFKGKVVDAQGKALAGLWVNAERRRGPDDDELNNLRVADALNRSALTNDQGEFEMAPLPPGTYEVRPDEYSRDSTREDRRRVSLPAVFVRQRITLKEGEEPQPLEVRAVPHVIVEAQYLDSKGKPTRGHECFIFGQIDGGSWFGQGRPDADGKIVARVPHGMSARMDLVTNEHGVLRWRKAPDAPLNNSRQVDLGTLNEDVKGIEIIRYVAPIVLVKVSAKDGGPLKDVVVSAEYPQGKGQFTGRLILKKGVRSDVSFEEQEDGRFRSSQLLPDEEVTLTAQAEGYQPRSEKIQLPEGATKELTLELDKK